MATNVVTWLRNYLAARDLDTEVAGGLAVERLPRDHLSNAPLMLERLPAPLHPGVRRVAVVSLIVFGVLCGAGALYVAGGLIAVVSMPLMLGREGVGRAMITLFTVCVTAISSAVLLLAARSAARVLRREQRGVQSLYLFSVLGLIVTILAGAITYWLKVAFFDSDAPAESNGYLSAVVAVMLLVFMTWFARAAIVLRRFAREQRKNGSAARATN